MRTLLLILIWGLPYAICSSLYCEFSDGRFNKNDPLDLIYFYGSIIYLLIFLSINIIFANKIDKWLRKGKRE